MNLLSNPKPVNTKIEQLLHPAYPLTKEDVVWILEFIKKNVVEEDHKMPDLSQPRILYHFRIFAEVALMVIRRRPQSLDQEADHVKQWLREAADEITIIP